MSGSNNPHTPSEPSIRALAIKLLADLDGLIGDSEGVAGLHRNGDLAPWASLLAGGEFEAWLGSIETLRSALQTIEPRAYEPWSAEAEAWIDAAYRQPAADAERWIAPRYMRANMIQAYMAGRFAQSRTRPGPIERIDLALEGIALIKRGAPPGELRPEHVQAVVMAAEHVLEQDAGYGLRQDADRRAIERWQAGEPHPDVEGLIVAARAVFDGMDKATAASMPAQRLGQAIVKAHTGINSPTARRGLIWPDHADLVVWLLELVHRRPDVTALREVEGVRDRLRRAIVASGGNPLAKDAKAMIDSLVQLALWADRRAFLAETALARLQGDAAAGGMNGRLHLVASGGDHMRSPVLEHGFRELETPTEPPVESAFDRLVSHHGDDGLGSREQSFGGGDVPGQAEGACGHYPLGSIEPGDLDATRQALESQVNGYLANLASNIGVTQARAYVSSAVATIAPGWEYAEITKLADAAPQVVLTQYDPDSPI